MIKLEKGQSWSYDGIRGKVERIIIRTYLNNRGTPVVDFVNNGGTTKYTIHDSEFISWININGAKSKEVEAKDILKFKSAVTPIIQSTTNNTKPTEVIKDIEPKINTTVISKPTKIDPVITKPISSLEESLARFNRGIAFEHLKKDEKVVVYIDGANLSHTTRDLGYTTDYKKLRSIIDNKCNLRSMYYYTSSGKDIKGYTAIQQLIDYLNFNGYNVIDRADRNGLKSNIDTDLVVDAMLHGLRGNFDHIILISGDSDFTRMIAVLQDNGIKATVVSSIIVGTTNNFSCSKELRRQANYFVDLNDIKNEIQK